MLDIAKTKVSYRLPELERELGVPVISIIQEKPGIPQLKKAVEQTANNLSNRRF